ncbi:MAG: enoyl-CoA hydratase/isomerase family protein [Deltaproteobacteria bacterium]|nr:enoyl-CoA hydratase/isomerase family protein [bacterium]MCB9475375.1 enoyl-CoA hydratase/isomerase family protein [Deltaproteobacteria bacterium]MCB9478453.1 enoyl-CoA hydratase/isomerase family protein [Deltaproteobacteria bacterium]MCB9489952.1 enoyl-CoA hydratase/isomerase family protein [Deltaproteobacteria bacterium]
MSQEYETLIVEQEGSVAVIQINRPKALNAINTQVLIDLEAAMRAIHADSSVKAVVLTGAGEKSFVAGADIAEMSDFTPLDGVDFGNRGQRVFGLIANGPKPVIAAVNGFALGGGTELALACDFIYASEKAIFGLPEITLGINPGFGGTQRLPRAVGQKMAMELVLTGDKVDAAEALRIGLANKVCPPEELLAAAKKTAAKIASYGARAVTFAKENVNHSTEWELERGLAVEVRVFGVLCSTHDKAEGMKAFLEKRKPEFKDY